MFIRNSLAALTFAATLATLSSAQTIQINRENKTIAISTTDEATATADIAAVTVGFSIYGPDSDSTYAHAGRLSQAILKALRAAGVPDKSIESAAQGLQQNTDFNDKDTPEFRAQHKFVFSQSWTVSVLPKEAAEVIRLAIAAGANQTGAIDWRLSDRKALQAKAAQAALVKARAVASQMAEGLHVKLGELMYASNQTPNTQIYFAKSRDRFELNTESAGVAGSLVAPALEIRPQTVREEATVYAVFSIE